jgi:hypothetical protein
LLKKTFLYLFLVLSAAGIAQSQKRNFRQRELGFFGGASYYIGDINPRGHFMDSREYISGIAPITGSRSGSDLIMEE